MKSEAVVAAVDNFDLSELSEAAARFENAISWNDTDPKIVEYEDDDDDNYEEDVDWYTGDCDDELDDTAYTAGTPTDDQELLEQFDQVYASASRSFQEARELLARVKSVRGYFPVVGIGAFDGHPLIEILQSLEAKARRAGGKESPLLRKVENRQVWVHLAFCQKHRAHVPSLVLRCPRSIRLKLVQLVVDHIMLLVSVLISACCVGKLDIVYHNVPTMEKRLHFHLENVHLVLMLWVVQCSISSVVVQLSKKSNKIKTRKTLKILLRFQSRVWRGSQFLTVEPRRQFLDS